MKEIIKLENIKRDFKVGDETVHALRGVSFTIYEGEFVTIMGTSGSGKSTLLNTLGCLDTPTSGEYYLDGVSVRTMGKNSRATLRNRKIGFVFQSYNLLPKTTAIENVELPLMYNPNYSAAARREKAIESLIAVGLGDRLMHKSNQMSGGQMQRVAIARALVNDPAVILADEATGNLDTRTSFDILVLFQRLHAEGRTIIFVTHNPEIAQYSSRNITLRDGRITSDIRNGNILRAADALAQLAEPGSVDALLPLALKVGEVNLGCMRLLDEANTGTYGTPEPTTVAMEVEPGPFIVISGHDLHDLKLLLEQTEGTGVSVYTHGEMLPAHA